VAFVYGSVAREEDTAQSDVDLMIPACKFRLEFRDGIYGRVDRAADAFLDGREPREYLIECGLPNNHFLTAVLKRQKVFLLGDEDEFRKVGGVLREFACHDQ
jgi:predicted nucleotidyltransferase